MYTLLLRPHRSMAASSLNAVRVRLYFDYPPPGMPDCRMSWVLVDLNKCRVVADLCSVIREKFDYSRKTVLDLFVEDCFLPPAESIYVVRDNDRIRVKVSGVPFAHVGKKRCRDEEVLTQTPTKKNRHETTEANGFPQPAAVTKKNHKAKKKKREAQQVACRDYVKAAVPVKEQTSSKSQTAKSSTRASASSKLTNGNASLSGSRDKNSVSSDSSEEVLPNLSANKSKSHHRVQVTSSKRLAARKSSSSGDDDENVPEKNSSKPSTVAKLCTGHKTSKGSTAVPPKSATNTAAVKKTQTESSSDSSSSQDGASAAAARNSIVPAKSSSGQKKPTNPTLKAKPQTMPASSSSSSSSSSENDESRRKGKSQALQKAPSILNKSVSLLPAQSCKASASKTPTGTSKTSRTQTTSDSSSSSGEEETSQANVLATPKSLNAAVGPCAAVEYGATPTPCTPIGTMLRDNDDKAERMDSSSSSDTELVIKKPNPQLMAGFTPRGRGRVFPDRVKGRGGVRGGFGRARGTPWKQNFHCNYDSEEQRQRQEIQTNESVLLQNPPDPSPRRDYSTLPLLAAPPAVGQKIAFKLLELTENYTPEVSDYKEGKIICFNYSTGMIELELLTQSQARAEPGKFDLVYENPDGSERVEYAVTVGSQLTERWDSLLEPRLIVQNTD